MLRTVHIPTSLPRLSAASIMLTFALVSAVATAVGVGAWSISHTSTTSSSGLTAATNAAYQRGLAAGEAKGAAAVRGKAKKAGFASGVHKGYRHGYRVGLQRGQTIGYQQGHAAGYSEGYAAALKTRTTTTKTTKH